MYNLLISIGLSAAAFVGVTLAFGPIAAALPAVAVFGVALFLLARRTNQLVQAELSTIGALLQGQRVDEAETKLVLVKERYARWQFLLAGQIDAQLGMIAYLTRRFDEARPKLEAGKWRNGPVLAMLGALDYRKGDKDAAFKNLEAAATATPSDAALWALWATLLHRDGKSPAALEVLTRGLKELPNHKVLTELKGKIANKQKVDPRALGESWYQYFPEDLAQQMAMRGTRGSVPGLPRPPQAPQPRFGARHAPRR